MKMGNTFKRIEDKEMIIKAIAERKEIIERYENTGDMNGHDVVVLLGDLQEEDCDIMRATQQKINQEGEEIVLFQANNEQLNHNLKFQIEELEKKLQRM